MWNLLARLEGQTLKTLDRGQPFQILRVSDTALIVRTSTGKNRRIPRKQIEDAWGQLAATGSLTRQEIRENFAEFNPAYVAALLSNLPGVITELKPIRLRLKRA